MKTNYDNEPWVKASDRIPEAKRKAAERAFVAAVGPKKMTHWAACYGAIAEYAKRVNEASRPG